jgi:chromosome segregation ATPase
VTDKLRSELVTAAEELDAELTKFERAVRDAEKQPLDTRRGLARAAEVLREVVSSDERLGRAVATLVAAVGAARERQQRHAEAVQARALEIQKRTEQLTDLLDGYGALGEAAAAVTARLAEVLTASREDRRMDLGDLEERVTAVATQAAELQRAASDRGFADIAKEAESMRQQLLSGVAKVVALQQKLS